MGYFPYKFNPDATNLGEFLFRTGTYPLYLISNFNHSHLLAAAITAEIEGLLRGHP